MTRSRKRLAVVLTAALLPLLYVIAPARAATLSVVAGGGPNPGCTPDVPYGSLSEAVGCATAGDTITVGPGTFVEPAQIFIDKAVTIVGAGRTQTIIDGSGMATPPSSPSMMLIQTTGDVAVSDLTLQNSAYIGVHVRTPTPAGPAAATLTRIGIADLTGINGYGLYCYGNSMDITLQDSVISETSSNPVLLDLCTGAVTIDGNTISPATTLTSVFVMTYDANLVTAPLRITDNHVARGGISVNAPPSFAPDDVAAYADVAVSGNTLTDQTGSGILLTAFPGGSITSPVVMDNHLTAAAGNTGDGVRITGNVTNAAVTANTISGYGDGIDVRPGSTANPTTPVVLRNRVVGNTVGLTNTSTALVDATNNWWGCNEGPLGAGGCDTVTNTGSGSVDADPWLTFTFAPPPAATVTDGTSTDVGVATRSNSDGDPVPGGSPSGQATFAATLGMVTPSSGSLVDGAFGPATFTASGSGDGSVSATLDQETITAAIEVKGVDTPAPPGPGPDPDLSPTPADVVCGSDVPTGSFPDVPSTSVHAPNIDCAATLGIVEGFGDGEFGPGSNLTRGQAASVIARLLRAAGFELPATPADAFTDDDGSTHELAIEQLAELDLLRGTANGTFGVNEPLRRDQLASILARTYRLISGDSSEATGDHFADDDGTLHEGAINLLFELGITEGNDEGAFGIGGVVGRDEMASFAIRLLATLIDLGAIDAP